MGKIGSFLIILFFAFSANAAVKVTATVDRNIVGLGDSLQYTITVESDSGVSVGAPRLPVIEGFEFVGRSQNSQFMSTFDMSKGKLVSNRQENYVFEFQANKEGKFVLGATEVVVDGKPFQTNKIEITVGPKSSNVAQQGGGSADEDESDSGEDNDPFSQLLRQHGFRGFKTAPPQNLNQAFFIQLEVDKTEAFVNEQVTASWYIYTRYNITDIDTLKYPALQKFWKEDVEVATRLNFTQEIVNGIPYRKALLARYALFPLKPGDAVVDEYKAKCMVLTDSIFGSFGFNRPRSYTRSSQTAKINVKALPKEGMPSDFSGAVGAFDVSASISSPVVKVNEPFTYKIRWQGRGNAKRIELPPLQIPTSLEEYDTKVESRY
ncbi:MAG: protein BatD, partial [Bdellovibrionales bacterium]|nr:protein BatD [Bdellovibrionales bacterium]